MRVVVHNRSGKWRWYASRDSNGDEFLLSSQEGFETRDACLDALDALVNEFRGEIQVVSLTNGDEDLVAEYGAEGAHEG